MQSKYFYYGTIKNIVAAFGILFKNMKYLDDYGEEITVPLHYAAKDAFLEVAENDYNYFSGLDMDVAFSRMGFELVTVMFDSQRMMNPLSKVVDADQSEEAFMFNRVPYNLGFNLYLTSRRFEDSLEIIEQIVPFFTPEFNITIRDKEDFKLSTDIPFVLNDINFEISWNRPSYTERTNIIWTLNFTAKAWLYSNVREKTRIKETIINMSNLDFSNVYETLTSEVVPRSATIKDPHTIQSAEYEDIWFLIEFETGAGIAPITLSEGYDYFSYLHIDDPVETGEVMTTELIENRGPIKLIYPKFYSGELGVFATLEETPINLLPYDAPAYANVKMDVDLQVIPGFMVHFRSGQEIRGLEFLVFKPFN